MFAKKTKMRMAVLALMLCVCSVIAFAASVPQEVLDARNSVVRIYATGGGGAWMGTGFTVERNSRYVVTNAHVAEGAEYIYVFYDTDKYIVANILIYREDKDIAILELQEPLANTSGLPLRVFDFESGLEAYALGYPGGADHMSNDEFLADKKSMTITNGIVGAIRQGDIVGGYNTSTWIVQTNVAINGGNSGGPLLDSRGRVLGINTFYIIDTVGINGSVHVTELIAILEGANIPYIRGEYISTGTIVGIVAMVIVAGITLFVYLKNRKKWKKVRDEKKLAAGATALPQDKKTPLKDFYTFGNRLNEYDGVSMVEDFMEDYFQPDEVAANAVLLFPDNIYVENGKALRFFKTTLTEQERWQAAAVYEGFSAPEAYAGKINGQTIMYFMGAILYVLTEGKTPGGATARSMGEALVFSSNNKAKAFIEQAMALEPQNRFADMKVFLYRISETKLKLFAGPAEPQATPPQTITPVAQANQDKPKNMVADYTATFETIKSDENIIAQEETVGEEIKQEPLYGAANTMPASESAGAVAWTVPSTGVVEEMAVPLFEVGEKPVVEKAEASAWTTPSAFAPETVAEVTQAINLEKDEGTDAVNAAEEFVEETIAEEPRGEAVADEAYAVPFDVAKTAEQAESVTVVDATEETDETEMAAPTAWTALATEYTEGTEAAPAEEGVPLANMDIDKMLTEIISSVEDEREELEETEKEVVAEGQEEPTGEIELTPEVIEAMKAQVWTVPSFSFDEAPEAGEVTVADVETVQAEEKALNETADGEAKEEKNEI